MHAYFKLPLESNLLYFSNHKINLYTWTILRFLSCLKLCLICLINKFVSVHLRNLQYYSQFLLFKMIGNHNETFSELTTARTSSILCTLSNSCFPLSNLQCGAWTGFKSQVPFNSYHSWKFIYPWLDIHIGNSKWKCSNEGTTAREGKRP